MRKKFISVKWSFSVCFPLYSNLTLRLESFWDFFLKVSKEQLINEDVNKSKYEHKQTKII